MIISIFLGALINYPGEKIYYILFSLVFNGLLLKGFYRQKFYFESFFSALLWLGFWLKFSIRTLSEDYSFKEPIGQFDFTPQAFDKVLGISTIAGFTILCVFLIAHYIFRKRNFLKIDIDIFQRPDRFLEKRKYFYFLFLMILLAVSFLNLHLGIYQRGSVPQYNPPVILRGIIVWLLLTGLAVASSTLIFWEIKTHKSPMTALIFALIESLLTNLSMLSRAFIINTIPQIWATFRQNGDYLVSRKAKIFLALIFFGFFVTSIVLVNSVRAYYFVSPNIIHSAEQVKLGVYQNTISLFIDRWVGIEGVMSISSYPGLGWELWNKIASEKVETSGTSYYDREVGNSAYAKNTSSNHHYISLPGIIGFLYYPGSIIFLM